MIGVDEALARLLALAPDALDRMEEVPLMDAAGRPVLRDVTSLRTQPARALSAMDGYAVRGAAPWAIMGESAAGTAWHGAQPVNALGCPPPDLATGYRSWFGYPVPFTQWYAHATLPSGNLISTAEEMTHYLIAQLNGGRYGGSKFYRHKASAPCMNRQWLKGVRIVTMAWAGSTAR